MSFVVTVILLAGMWGRSGFAQAGEASVEARTAAVNRVLADYRDDERKREPEVASLAGDKRYDDQLSDFSASAANARLSRGQTYIQRLSEIDTTGLPEKTRVSAEGLLNSLIEEQAGNQAKTWQRPLEQFTRLHGQLMAIAEKLSFESVKDYDDYVARLKKIPNAFSQMMTNLQLGSEAGRIPAQASVEGVMTEVQAISAEPAETSAFAAPLKRFPAAVGAADRKRIAADVLDTISNDVIPGYQRVGRFVAAQSAGAGATVPVTRPASLEDVMDFGGGHPPNRVPAAKGPSSSASFQ